MKQIPGPTGHWLFGSMYDILQCIHRFPAQAAREHGGLAKLRVLNRRLVVTVKPEHVQHVLIDNAANYIKSYHYKNAIVLSGEGIISSDGELWRSRRRQVQPGFASSYIQGLVDVVNRECRLQMDGWERSGRSADYLNIVPETRTLGLRIITRALLGIELQTERAVAFGDAVVSAMRVIGRRNNALVFPMWVPTAGNRAVKRTRHALDSFLLEQIRTRKRMIAAGEDTPGGMMESYLRPQVDAAEPTLDENALLVETKTLFLAGYETASTTLAWSLYHLAAHPDIADRCRMEVDRVLNGAPPANESLQALELLQAVVMETLRIAPPLVHLGREAAAADELDGYTIPKGTTVLISVFGLHRSPDLWDEPDTFRPERFTPENRSSIPRNAYIPFGAGNRRCLGSDFAMIEEVAVLALILQRYTLELEPGYQPTETMQVTLNPGPRVPIRMTPRTRT